MGTPGAARPAARAEFVAANHEKIEAYEKLAAEFGEDPANLALAWLLHQSGVTGPIVGPRTIAHSTAPCVPWRSS